MQKLIALLTAFQFCRRRSLDLSVFRSGTILLGQARLWGEHAMLQVSSRDHLQGPMTISGEASKAKFYFYLFKWPTLEPCR